MSSSRLLWCALLVAVAALTYGSVQSTSALWRDQATVPDAGSIATGKLVLTAGAPGSTQSATYPFEELKPPGRVQIGDYVQRPLTLVNAGTIPLKFRLGTAAVPSSSAGVATVHLDVRLTASTTECPTTGALPVGTKTLANVDVATKGSASGALEWTDVARGASVLLCVRSTLVAAPAMSVSYRHVFTFDAQQTKNNP